MSGFAIGVSTFLAALGVIGVTLAIEGRRPFPGAATARRR